MTDTPKGDKVDILLEQWAQQRPDLDTTPMGIIGRLGRTTKIIEQHLKSYFATHNLELWEFDVLATLRRSGPPYTLTPKNLADSTMVGNAAMTNRVDRLTQRGLVTRQTNPVNRRQQHITLTPTGLHAIDTTITGHLATERHLIQTLTATEQHQLDQLLKKLLITLDT